jgi:uncharacterized membrane protein YdjX (TVP38/TMEM64 family)
VPKTFLPWIKLSLFGFPPAAIFTVLIAATLFAGIADPLVEDENREWWARSAGYFLLLMFTWLIAVYISLPPDNLLKAANGAIQHILGPKIPEPVQAHFQSVYWVFRDR